MIKGAGLCVAHFAHVACDSMMKLGSLTRARNSVLPSYLFSWACFRSVSGQKLDLKNQSPGVSQSIQILVSAVKLAGVVDQTCITSRCWVVVHDYLPVFWSSCVVCARCAQLHFQLHTVVPVSLMYS